MRRITGAAIGLVLPLLLGCSGLGPTPLVLPATDNALPDTPRNLPTHADSGATMLATLKGQLVLDGPCLLIAADATTYLPIWPSAYWLDGRVLRSGRDHVAEVGETIRLTGGHVPLPDPARLTNPVDLACLRREVFWVGG